MSNKPIRAWWLAVPTGDAWLIEFASGLFESVWAVDNPLVDRNWDAPPFNGPYRRRGEARTYCPKPLDLFSGRFRAAVTKPPDWSAVVFEPEPACAKSAPMAHPCNCELNRLMAFGCQCGGI